GPTAIPERVVLTSPRAIVGSVLRAAVFDVDFTLAKPGPDLGPAGYVRVGRRHGLELDAGRYEDARREALATLRRHPELDHDEEIWVLFTQRIIEGMGGVGDTYGAAFELERSWVHAHHFELYEDVLPALARLRDRGIAIGLLSNSARDIDAFAVHHGLAVDAALTSGAHGKTKPHDSIFRRMLELLGVSAETAVMVGDSVEDDIAGARAVGMRAVLVDREHRSPDQDAIAGLGELPALLGLD